MRNNDRLSTMTNSINATRLIAAWFPWLTTGRLVFLGYAWIVALTLLRLCLLWTDAPGRFAVFGSLWASGNAATHGQNPFAAWPLTWTPGDINLNPPTVLPLCQLFSLFDPALAGSVWTLVSSAIFVAVAAGLLSRFGPGLQRRQIVWMFFSVGVVHTILIGHIYFIQLALTAAAWSCLSQRRAVGAGIFLGLLVSTKPNFALWPFFLFVSGYWQPAVIAGFVAFACVILSVYVYGLEAYLQWFAAVHSLGDTSSIDVSVTGLLLRFGMPRHVGNLISIVIVIVTAVWLRRRDATQRDASRVGLSLSLLASPIAWIHYSMVFMPALIEMRWGIVLTVAASIMLVPWFIPVELFDKSEWLLSPWGSSIYFVAVALVFFSFLSEIARKNDIAPAQSPD